MASVCYNQYGNGYYCNSAWYSWGRWVLFGVVVVAFILFFFLCSCLSQRRRRKAGRQPFYGTGWTQNLPMGGPPQYSSNKPNYQNPPPQYGQQNNYQPNQNQEFYGGQHGGANQSYFGGQQTELEMQPPQNVYGNRGGDNYAPPAGPPPSKR